MAAAMLRNTSGSPDENIIPAQRISTGNVSSTSSGRRHHSSGVNSASMNYKTDPGHISRASDFQRAHSISYKNNLEPIHGDGRGRSFAARTRDLPPEMNGPLLPEPSDLSDEYSQPGYPVAPEIPLPIPESQGYGIPQDTSPFDPGQTSSRRQSEKDQRHDWADDRSPLQKLEVTLNGISKEEKRARVQEAEMKLKERMARQKSENNNRDIPPAGPRSIAMTKEMDQKPANLARAASNGRPKHGQPVAPHEGSIQVTKRQEHRQLPLDYHRGLEAEAQDQFERTKSTHGRAPSLQYPETRPAKQPQYANDGPIEPTVKRGNVPRRSVTVSKHPGANGGEMPPRIRHLSDDASGPNRAGAQVRQLPDPVTVPVQNPQRQDQPMAFDSGGRKIGQRQQSAHVGPHSIGMDAQRPQRGVSPGQGEVGKTGPVNVELDRNASRVPIQPQGPQNGISSQPKPKRQTVSFNVPPPTPPPIAEWKNAPVTRLNASDFDFQNFDIDRSKAWWEGGASANRRKSRALPNQYHKPVQKPKGTC